jgi:O-antigen/teichoic acid export membrane protein
MSELRRRAVEGSLYLSLRRVFTIALSIAGMLYVTRIIGPANYGLYASAMGVYMYLTQLVSMGVRTYLIRAPQDAPREVWHQAFWWLLGFGSVLTVVALIALWLLGAYWIRTEGFFAVATAISVGLPLHAVRLSPKPPWRRSYATSELRSLTRSRRSARMQSVSRWRCSGSACGRWSRRTGRRNW